MVEPEAPSDKTIEHYNLIRQLGDGTFGIGYLSYDTTNEKHVCVKVFKDMDEETQESFAKEVQAGQAGLFHDNVLRMLGAGKSAIKRNGTAITDETFYLVSELAENGEVFDYVQMAGGLSDVYARQVFGQIIMAVDFIHQQGIAHRDLKLENVFMSKDCRCKLADFGMQKAFAGPNGAALMTQCGTVAYRAPEMKEGDAYDGPSVDIFALGHMLYITRFANFGFMSCKDLHYKRLMKNPERAMQQKNLKYEPEFLNLLVGMLKADPKQRLTMQQIKEHAWFQAQTATPEQILQHYDSLKSTDGGVDYEAKQAAKKEYATSGTVARSTGDEAQGPDADEVESWEELLYRRFDEREGNSLTGFFSKSLGSFVFNALWQFLAERDIQPEVSTKHWKMKFTLEKEFEKPEPCADFSDEEDEEDTPTMSADVTCTIKVVKENMEDEFSPSQVFVNFHRRSGNAVLFVEFVKEVMATKLECFVETV